MSDRRICPECGKLCLTYREAGEIINSCKHHRNMAKNIPKRKYYCRFAKAYHVTSNKAGYVSKDAYYKMDKR